MRKELLSTYFLDLKDAWCEAANVCLIHLYKNRAALTHDEDPLAIKTKTIKISNIKLIEMSVFVT